MIRRCLAASLCILLLVSSAVAESADAPAAIVAILYKQTLAALKTQSESAFFKPAVRAKYFSKSFNQLITASEAKAARSGDVGLDFDPIISGQDAQIKTVTYTTDLMEADKAIVSAHFLNFDTKTVVAYDFIKEGGGWKIDDVRGMADKDSWSIRKILSSPDQ